MLQAQVYSWEQKRFQDQIRQDLSEVKKHNLREILRELTNELMFSQQVDFLNKKMYKFIICKKLVKIHKEQQSPQRTILIQILQKIKNEYDCYEMLLPILRDCYTLQQTTVQQNSSNVKYSLVIDNQRSKHKNSQQFDINHLNLTQKNIIPSAQLLKHPQNTQNLNNSQQNYYQLKSAKLNDELQKLYITMSKSQLNVDQIRSSQIQQYQQNKIKYTFGNNNQEKPIEKSLLSENIVKYQNIQIENIPIDNYKQLQKTLHDDLSIKQVVYNMDSDQQNQNFDHIKKFYTTIDQQADNNDKCPQKVLHEQMKKMQMKLITESEQQSSIYQRQLVINTNSDLTTSHQLKQNINSQCQQLPSINQNQIQQKNIQHQIINLNKSRQNQVVDLQQEQLNSHSNYLSQSKSQKDNSFQKIYNIQTLNDRKRFLLYQHKNIVLMLNKQVLRIINTKQYLNQQKTQINIVFKQFLFLNSQKLLKLITNKKQQTYNLKCKSQLRLHNLKQIIQQNLNSVILHKQLYHNKQQLYIELTQLKNSIQNINYCTDVQWKNDAFDNDQELMQLDDFLQQKQHPHTQYNDE